MAKTVKYTIYCGFSSLSDIDKITRVAVDEGKDTVLVHCRILIKSHMLVIIP